MVRWLEIRVDNEDTEDELSRYIKEVRDSRLHFIIC